MFDDHPPDVRISGSFGSMFFWVVSGCTNRATEIKYDKLVRRSASLCKLCLEQEVDCYINGLTVLCASNVQLGTLARHFSRFDEGCV